jgi:hypothetical protein
LDSVQENFVEVNTAVVALYYFFVVLVDFVFQDDID